MNKQDQSKSAKPEDRKPNQPGQKPAGQKPSTPGQKNPAKPSDQKGGGQGKQDTWKK